MEINNVFKRYYIDLYSSEHDINTPKIESFETLFLPSIPFYKKFAPELSPLLQAIFIESLSSGQLPPILQQAAITLIPQKKKAKIHANAPHIAPSLY